MENPSEPRAYHPKTQRKVVQGDGSAPCEIDKRAALREILGSPDDYSPQDDDVSVDPYEGWERVPPNLDELLQTLRRLEKTYEHTSWWLRRFELAGWLDEISESYGPFRCLADLSLALRSIDSKDAHDVHPMVRPDFRQGRPKLTRTEFRNHCMIALAIDALKVAGWNIEESAKAIVEWLSKRSNRTVRIRTIRYSTVPVPSWETIKNWREEIVRISQGKGRHPSFIREMAADYLSQRDRLPGVLAARGVDPKDMAVLLLAQMRPLSGLGKT